MTTGIPGVDTLIADVAAGRIRGPEAFDAVVDRLVHQETPAQASAELRAQIRDQVVLVVGQDRELCSLLLHGAAPKRQRPESTKPSAAEAELAPGHRAGAAMRPPKRASTAGDPGPALLSDAEIDAELDLIDRERAARRRADAHVGAPQRRGQLLGGAALLGVAVVGGAAWFFTQPTACDLLVKRVCMEGKTQACELVTFKEALDREGVDDARCEAAMASIDEAVAGKNNTDRPAAFDQALVAALGFDPRGDAAPKPPVPKRTGPPPPTVVVTGQSSMSGMFLDRAHLYWTNTEPSGVFRVRNIGGEVEAFGSQPDPVDVTPTKDNVYWLSRASVTATIWMDKVRGARAPAAVELEGYRPARAAFFDTEVAFIDAASGAVVIAPVDGTSPPRVLVPGRVAKPKRRRRKRVPDGPPPVSPTELIGDAMVVYVATPAPVSTVWAVPRSGEAPARALAVGQVQPKHLVDDETHVYWLEAQSGTIARAPKEGGPVQALATGQSAAGQLAVDDERVYWAEGSAGAVRAVPKLGGEVATLASGLENPRFVAVDRAAYFWESGGTVYRQAR